MIGKIFGNRYEIIEKIGGGGMSVVYKAKDKLLNRYVAIKVLREELTSDPEFIDKFKQESLSAASLNHPNIVNIYDTGTEDGVYYIVMEYINGETLKDYIKREGHLSEKETIRITRQIAEALKHAHANNVIHRDIKPHNILLTKEGIVKVADFGIAKAATSSTINSTSNVIGSVHYFSPEQARGGYVDAKSDIYSLGVVMYEMITGVVPFDADNHISVAMKHIKDKVVPPSEKVKDIEVSSSLEKIIMKCLEKHQSYRYQNITELLNDLNSIDEAVIDNNTKVSEDLVDSPTIIMPKIDEPIVDDKPIEIKNNETDKAFNDFFNNTAPEEESKNKKDNYDKKTRAKITALAIFLAFVTACVGGFFVIKSILIVPDVTVPSVLGMTEDEAKAELKKYKLELLVKDTEYSADFAEGQISRQSVEPGKTVKRNYPIEVYISMGVKDVAVPNVVGKYSVEAVVMLEDQGFKEGKITSEYSDTVPSGMVISQNPKANEMATLGTEVDLIVSQGPNVSYTTVPELLGLDEAAALQRIVQYNLAKGQVLYDYSDKYEKGQVMLQNYPAGIEIEAGIPINITVSQGPKEEEEPATETPGETENPDETTTPDNPNNPGTSTEQPDEEKYSQINIPLPNDRETVTVSVYKVNEDGNELVYQKQVNTSELSVLVTVSGTGTQKFEIYIDDELYGGTSYTVDF